MKCPQVQVLSCRFILIYLGWVCLLFGPWLGSHGPNPAGRGSPAPARGWGSPGMHLVSRSKHSFQILPFMHQCSLAAGASMSSVSWMFHGCWTQNQTECCYCSVKWWRDVLGTWARSRPPAVRSRPPAWSRPPARSRPPVWSEDPKTLLLVGLQYRLNVIFIWDRLILLFFGPRFYIWCTEKCSPWFNVAPVGTLSLIHSVGLNSYRQFSVLCV